MKLKKAAMFGLDARIALAIFGALSVISGAALYSAIQHSKVVSIVSSMNEIGKAVEQFILDTGVYIPDVVTDDTTDAEEYLITNSLSTPGWQGPYISYDIHTNGVCFKSQSHDFICLDIYRQTPHAGVALADRQCTTASTSCSYWAAFKTGTAELKALETYIDGTVSPGDTNYSGNFVYNVTEGYGSYNLRVLFPVSQAKN